MSDGITTNNDEVNFLTSFIKNMTVIEIGTFKGITTEKLALVNDEVITIDPYISGFVGLAFFYISLLFALSGTLSVIGYYIRSRFHKEELTYEQVANAFRQAILLSIFFTGSLILKSQGLLTWWNIVLFILALVLFEIFTIIKKNKQKPYTEQDPEPEQTQEMATEEVIAYSKIETDEGNEDYNNY